MKNLLFFAELPTIVDSVREGACGVLGKVKVEVPIVSEVMVTVCRLARKGGL